LNQVYANVFNKSILVPEQEVTSLGSAIFAFVAAGEFETIEEAQETLCPSYKEFKPQPDAVKIYEELYQLYRQVYFSFGASEQADMSEILPQLRKIAAKVR